MSGKKYTVTVVFFDHEPSDSPRRDVEQMLTYGHKHQDWHMYSTGDISVEEWDEDD